MIAVDTGILIWGIRRIPDPNRSDLVQQCVELLALYKSRGQPIMLPSVVVAEYLTGFSPDKQMSQRAILGTHFFIAPFDARAASIAAELYDPAIVDEIKRTEKVRRQCIKADVKIIATAIAHGATTIFVDDGHFMKLAKGRIIARAIPTLRELKEERESSKKSTPSTSGAERSLPLFQSEEEE